MQNDTRFIQRSAVDTGLTVSAEQRVLRNTYWLLSMTLAFSALTATAAMSLNMGFVNPFLMLGVYFGLLFATHRTQNSSWGLLWVFALTGWLGLTLGPLLNVLLATQAGSEVVLTALGGTAVIFLGLSSVSLITRKNFSFLANFLFVGALVLMIAVVANLFLHLSAMSLMISCVALLLSSGLILWQTSEIIHGGETNYISATVTLYVSLYNIFLSLIQLLTAFGGGDD